MATSATPSMNNTSFDLEGYIGNYTGHARIQRMRFIAERVGAPLELEALRMAADELKKGENTVVYTEVIEQIGGRLGDAYQLDKDWIVKVERESAKRLEKLELELNQYKANLIKESIRMGHNDLGDFYYEQGDLQSAFKSYVRTRDYCTTSKHVITMCLNVIGVSFELGNYVHVTNYVQKAEQTPDVSDPVVLAKLRCAAGLAALENKKYKLAARKFVEVHTELLGKSNYSEVISPQDVAVYGALCALASFDRSELKTKVIDNNMFRNFLELVPEVRELIHDFYASRYASCLSYLDNLRTSLALDIHLHDHVERLYEQIRHKALIQYTTPFISVNLSTMAQAFNTTVLGIEKELAALIMDNQIQARIDSHNKILYARHADQRNATFQKTLATGEAYVRETHAMLLRASLLQHDFMSKPPK
mmetsp:Transcript_3835/g.7926  ORF Transcript_3835/g.7926 Transcript_3835/m.7926 type:complete len:420 (-) Transcript_3835:301-1560(-)|eukprot:CAMPEP_0118922816 /NCGR_PEP_ID=MMETSP1169-20130426/1605_1 /TAXON_ID=36882 /ORGANISM="Pyramimonas obovata, Strain CCMP722" /LENGTH=419 /DNA_ID=CAMNT_0006863741 /DNA_START=283 /DNA_END=1542 /DNA_ORIENTATION=+